MLVPEASVYKDYFLLWSEYDIRRARKLPIMESITITKAMNEAPDYPLGTSVLGFHSTH